MSLQPGGSSAAKDVTLQTAVRLCCMGGSGTEDADRCVPPRDPSCSDAELEASTRRATASALAATALRTRRRDWLAGGFIPRLTWRRRRPRLDRPQPPPAAHASRQLQPASTGVSRRGEGVDEGDGRSTGAGAPCRALPRCGVYLHCSTITLQYICPLVCCTCCCPFDHLSTATVTGGGAAAPPN